MIGLNRHTTSLIISLVINTIINAQIVALENVRGNSLTIGIDNEIIVAADSIPCEQLEIKTSNGLVKTTNNKCHLILVPLDFSKTIIEIYRKMNGQIKFIESKEFRVKNIELKLFITIGNRAGFISLNNLKIEDRVNIYAQGFDWDAESVFSVKKFKVEIHRNSNNQTLSYINSGNIFSKEIRDIFNTLKPNDTIRIHDVYIMTNNNYEMKIDDLNFVIIE